MIKVKIANKNGAELERELPTDIHQLYHDMRDAGISKPPKNILLHDDKDVEVTLFSDSKIGNRLLRVFGKNDTLADANTVAFAVSTAREEILTDLEQNIVHNQYFGLFLLFHCSVHEKHLFSFFPVHNSENAVIPVFPQMQPLSYHRPPCSSRNFLSGQPSPCGVWGF